MRTLSSNAEELAIDAMQHVITTAVLWPHTFIFERSKFI